MPLLFNIFFCGMVVNHIFVDPVALLTTLDCSHSLIH